MHFDQNKTIGALGTLIVAKWYRGAHPQHLLISLDSAEARRWMSLEDDAKRADLLGVSVEDGAAYIDILEVKSGEDARQVYRLTGDGNITGKPVEQLVNTSRSVGGIFGLNELKDHILTPPRREILRNHLYRQGFSGPRSPEEKQFWGDLLNALFKNEMKPTIRLHLVVVNLGLNQEALDTTACAEGFQIHLLHLNEQTVSVQLGGETLGERGTSATVVQRPPASSPSDATVEPSESPVTRVAAVPVRQDLKEQISVMCGKLRAACQDFGIRVTEIAPENVEIGPSVLRYKLKLAPGEQGEKLRRQAENIARQLAATSVPIIEFLRGTEYMYLDLARPDREIIRLEPILEQYRSGDANELPLNVGVDPAGKQYRLDLSDDQNPHLLVAGGTGSGKTIFLYSVVLSLVTAHSERSIELVIIDPKQTDFTTFAQLPHLRNSEVIVDAARGVESLREIAEHEMQARSDRLQRARCRDIKMFNPSHPDDPIRPLVVIIDEYADLVAVLPKKEREEFDRVISRLAARGRNVGIHLVVATQRPTADIITGNIKANMPCRISFSLPSSRDSQVILDEPGAERLLRNGDMLLMVGGQLIRLQGYYVDPATIEVELKRLSRA
jgi:DNA segregation ATPase FtsK/SpoIIIE, S-DNA-T family